MNIINDKINSLNTIRNTIIDLSCCGINYKSDILGIDEYHKYLQTNKIKIAVLGEFSSGKSSLLNALLKNHIFPTGDLPFTGLPISIESSDKLCLKINILNNYLKKFENILLNIINNYRINSCSKITLEDFCISTNGSNTSTISYYPTGIDELNSCLLELATTSDVKNCTQIRKKRLKNSSILKKILFYLKNKFGLAPYNIQYEKIKDIVINAPFDSILKKLSFVDLPGTDDINSRCDIKETEQFKNSNLVFLVLNAERTASVINENLQDWLNEHKNYIIIVNKIDLIDLDTFNKIQSKLSMKYDGSIFFVSSLLADIAYVLKKRSINSK